MGHEITAGNARSALPSSPLAEAKERSGASRGSRGGHHAARASAGRQGAVWASPSLPRRAEVAWSLSFPFPPSPQGLVLPLWESFGES